MNLKRIFNNSGDFIEKGYDPYRLNKEKYGDMHNFLFDEDGGLNYDRWMNNDIEEFIQTNQCGAFSDIVKLYWAQEMGSNTKGSYPAVYMWR